MTKKQKSSRKTFLNILDRYQMIGNIDDTKTMTDIKRNDDVKLRSLRQALRFYQII